MNYGSSFCFTCKSTFKSWLCKFSIPERRTYSPLPHRGSGGIPSAGRARALCRGLSAAAGSTGYAAIHNKLFQLVCLPIEIGTSGRSSCRIWLPAKTCRRQLFCRGTWLFPCSFIVQRYSQEGDDIHSNLPYVGKSDQPWRRPLRCRRFCLFKLQPYVQ